MLEYIMHVALCDDDPAELQLIGKMVSKAAAKEGLKCRLTLYESASALLSAIDKGAVHHALLLNVRQMADLEPAAALRRRHFNASIVLLSGSPDMAPAGYETGAARYLLKPLDPSKLQEALKSCYRAELGRQVFLLPTSRGMRRLSADQIVYIEAWGRGVRVVLPHGEEEAGIKISEMEKLLPASRFVLCHRTLLVNLAYVKYLRYCEIELTTGVTLPVSKYRQNATRDKVMRYQEE